MRRRDEQQRVTVGRRLGHRLRGDVAAGAGAVVDDHLLADAGGQARGEDAGVGVGATAGGEADQDADGAGGVVVEGGACGKP